MSEPEKKDETPAPATPVKETTKETTKEPVADPNKKAGE